MPARSNIALIGMASVGKSSLGKALAQRLALDFVDTDDLVIQRSGLSVDIGTLPTQIGDTAFMALENETRDELMTYTNTVIATGGSYIYLPEAMTVLRKIAIVIFLLDTFDIIKQRTNQRGNAYRLIRQGNRSLFELFIERNKLCQHYAHHTVNIAALDHNYDLVLDTIANLAAHHLA